MRHVPLCEDSHPHALADDPLGNVAVWVATVVGEATDSSLSGGVDVLQKGGAGEPERTSDGDRRVKVGQKDRLLARKKNCVPRPSAAP